MLLPAEEHSKLHQIYSKRSFTTGQHSLQGDSGQAETFGGPEASKGEPKDFTPPYGLPSMVCGQEAIS